MNLREIRETTMYMLGMGVFGVALLLGVASCLLLRRDLMAYHGAVQRSTNAFFRARQASLTEARRVMDARLTALAEDMTLETIDDINAAGMEALRGYLTTATKPAYTLRWGWDVVCAALHHPRETLTWQDGDVE